MISMMAIIAGIVDADNINTLKIATNAMIYEFPISIDAEYISMHNGNKK